MEFKHEPIMLHECLENLNIKADGIYVDGTLGGAGHSSKIVEHLNENGRLIGIDRDQDALTASRKRLEKYSNVTYVWGKHEDIKKHLEELEIKEVNGILLDLGVSSYQIDEPERGFSYTKDARLDMRMNREQELDAEYIINNYSKEELEKIFFEYGEENYSKRIVSKILKVRENKNIETTFELADIIREAVPKNTVDSLKRIFQALRIEVNGELKDLKKAVEGIEKNKKEKTIPQNTQMVNSEYMCLMQEDLTKAISFGFNVSRRTPAPVFIPHISVSSLLYGTTSFPISSLVSIGIFSSISFGVGSS